MTIDFGNILGGWSPTFVACERCAKETTRTPCWDCLKREDAERVKREADRLVGIPAEHEWASVESFKTAKTIVPIGLAPSDALAAVLGFGGTTVLLQGEQTGVGKTATACAALRELPGGLFARASRLGKAAAQHPMGRGEAPLIGRAYAARVLVIDELCGNDTTVHYDKDVLEVLWTRHEDRRLTIVTTGFTDEKLIARLGLPALRRLKQKGVCLTIGFGRPSARDEDPRQVPLSQVTSPSREAS